jgi:hypothetical protein
VAVAHLSEHVHDVVKRERPAMLTVSVQGYDIAGV